MSTNVQNIQMIHRPVIHENNTTITTTFGDTGYLLAQIAVPLLSFRRSCSLDGFFNSLKGDLRPCTLITWPEEKIDRGDLDAIISSLAVQDDSWTPAFNRGETSHSHENALEQCLH